MGRRKKRINNTNNPQHTIESIARRLLPDIMAYYQSDVDQREFAEWKTEQEKLKISKTTIAASPYKDKSKARMAPNTL